MKAKFVSVHFDISWLFLSAATSSPEAICFAHPCVRASMHQSVRLRLYVPQYFQYLLMDVCQTFVIGASRDKDGLIQFLESKGQGHIIVAEASST